MVSRVGDCMVSRVGDRMLSRYLLSKLGITDDAIDVRLMAGARCNLCVFSTNDLPAGHVYGKYLRKYLWKYLWKYLRKYLRTYLWRFVCICV